MMQRAPFGVRLAEATATLGPLCVGIDPHPELLRAWGLPVDPDGLRRFARTCVEAFAGHVALVKPQSAFFEEYGSAGIQVLEETLAAFRVSGTLTLLDVKRGDIGSTMAGYARAYLADGSPLAADAITVSPYLGFGSLAPAIALAGQTGRGVFVLALTSNPEGAQVQHARDDQGSVAGAVVAGAREANAAALSEGHLGHVGLVVGATIGSAATDLGIDLTTVNGPLLAPGFGAQGADAAAIRRLFGAALPAVLPSSSREVLGAGPDLRDLRAAAYGAWPGE
ncbi:Orotidine 5'-phosphate decarboxylase [Nostocoides jenkinsii Ben 74]|uniref:Orotidine 5'-phosphate decarboxylase n=2 Tax=Nostocoides jenkinsii TaxID=330834 RepID=A0A077MDJ5_9MICO|nr:Orotidine 5'-phosphate decarboxylase [Tetrasphaera jenkinsii Ben 74]